MQATGDKKATPNREAGSMGRYAKAFAPYLDIMRRVVLPRRFPKGDARNLERSMVVQAALHQYRVKHMPAKLRKQHAKVNCPGCARRVVLSRKPLR